MSASRPVATDSTQDVRVRFLMEEAPHEWLLVSGRRFELYEGRLLLAEGVIDESAGARAPDMWRRGWDSNPRKSLNFFSFQD